MTIFKTFLESTVAADIAQGSGGMQRKKELYKKCMNKDSDCTKDIDTDSLGEECPCKEDPNSEECKKAKEKLEESPVGYRGKTTDQEAGKFIDGNPELRAEFKNIVKKIGGVAVARRLLNSRLFSKN